MATIDGLTTVLGNMQNVTAKTIAAVADATEISAIRAANHAKAGHAVPEQAHAAGRYANRTSILTNSIIPDLVQANAQIVEADVTTNVEYGPYVEFGIHGKSGYPFMRPGLESQRKEFPKEVARAVNGNL
jgi:hypothetical protein